MSKKRNNKTVVKEYQPIPESMEDKAVECIEPEVSEAEQPVMEAANDKDVPDIIEGDILNEDVVNGEPCTEDAPVSSSETCETDKDAVIDLASSEVDKDMVIDSEACKVTEDTSCSEETNTETLAQETPDDGESNEETPEEVENDCHYVPISGNDDDDASDYYERSGNEKKQEKKPKNYDWIFYLVIAASMAQQTWVVPPHGLRTHEDHIHHFTQTPRLAPRRRAGDPLCLAPFVADLPVERHRQLHRHERKPRGDMLGERRNQPSRGIGALPPRRFACTPPAFRLDPRAPQHARGAVRVFGIWIGDRPDDFRDACGDQRLAASPHASRT